MTNQTTETITELLVETFSRIGIPEFLQSDQGRNFESHLLRETCNSLGIKKTHTSYHPQSNSLVERSNITILQMLRCYVNKNDDWEIFLFGLVCISNVKTFLYRSLAIPAHVWARSSQYCSVIAPNWT